MEDKEFEVKSLVDRCSSKKILWNHQDYRMMKGIHSWLISELQHDKKKGLKDLSQDLLADDQQRDHKLKLQGSLTLPLLQFQYKMKILDKDKTFSQEDSLLHLLLRSLSMI